MVERLIKENMYLKWPAEKSCLIKVTKWQGNSCIQSHKHEFVEIAFLVEGTCEHIYKNKKIKLIPGDIFVITPHENHSYNISSKTTIYNCLFYPEGLGTDWEKIMELKGVFDFLLVEPFYRTETKTREIIHLTPVNSEILESLLRKMIEEQDRNHMSLELILKSYLLIFLCTLDRIWEEHCSKSPLSFTNKRNLLVAALSYINSNFNNDISVENLASKVYLSPNHFRKIFKESTGLSPIEYINNIRIAKAINLLSEDKNISISEIGEAVGILDQNYFSRLFKHALGCSPREFRERSNVNILKI